ncbi:TetR/AcrR family transcriptional regulator [Streptomyces sp. NPDC020490]|uniref:TetR/AcrR family transcriptional regulator n=1 Tax=Streptomyces sp. NPDC020490 TaxID=3365078 RepID=UPI0037B2EFD4
MRSTDNDRCRATAGRPRCPGKQAAILDATLALLAQQGFARMTLDAVARAAGVSKATIHLRYRTKAALAAAALGGLRTCATPPPAADLHTELAIHLDDFAHALHSNHGMALIGTCLAEEPHTPALLRHFREHAVLPRRAALRATLERARDRGALPACTDPEPLVSALLGAVSADHLAGRAHTPDSARATVRAVLGLCVSDDR